MARILNFNEVKMESLVFSDVKDGDNGSKRCFVNLPNRSKVIFKTPMMKLPMGIKHWEKDPTKKESSESYELDMSFGGDSPEVSEFHSIMKKYDEEVVKYISNNSLKWLGDDDIDEKSIKKMSYTPSVRTAVDSKTKQKLDYPDSLKVKLDFSETHGRNFFNKKPSKIHKGTPVLAYDENRQQIEFNRDNCESVLSPGCSTQCIVQLVYVYMAKKITTKWKVIQMKVHKVEEEISGYAFGDEMVDQVTADTNNLNLEHNDGNVTTVPVEEDAKSESVYEADSEEESEESD